MRKIILEAVKEKRFEITAPSIQTIAEARERRKCPYFFTEDEVREMGYIRNSFRLLSDVEYKRIEMCYCNITFYVFAENGYEEITGELLSRGINDD